MIEKKNPGAANLRGLNERRNKTAGGNSGPMKSDLTKKDHVSQLESFENGSIVDRIKL